MDIKLTPYAPYSIRQNIPWYVLFNISKIFLFAETLGILYRVHDPICCVPDMGQSPGSGPYRGLKRTIIMSNLASHFRNTLMVWPLKSTRSYPKRRNKMTISSMISSTPFNPHAITAPQVDIVYSTLVRLRLTSHIAIEVLNLAEYWCRQSCSMQTSLKMKSSREFYESVYPYH
jgi:hypothetical protein